MGLETKDVATENMQKVVDSAVVEVVYHTESSHFAMDMGIVDLKPMAVHSQPDCTADGKHVEGILGSEAAAVDIQDMEVAESEDTVIEMAGVRNCLGMTDKGRPS